MAKTSTTTTQRTVVIEQPRMERGVIKIKGLSPYVQHRFTEKAMAEMRAKQQAGSVEKKGRARKAKDFEAQYKAAMHVSRQGWAGIPAPAFRNAMISACRLVGFKMTLAKLSLFVEADGFDKNDGTPLVKINGKPRVHEGMVRNANGMPDIRWRPMWETWSADVRLRWDASQFSAQDVINLMARVGGQVGVGEGRHDSKNSAGMGWGEFEVVS